MGFFFYGGRPFRAGLFHHELCVLLHQLLETLVAIDGLLDLTHLFRGNVAGNIPASFIALMVVVRPRRALAYHIEGASLKALDLSDVVENRLGIGFCIHEVVYV